MILCQFLVIAPAVTYRSMKSMDAAVVSRGCPSQSRCGGKRRAREQHIAAIEAGAL